MHSDLLSADMPAIFQALPARPCGGRSLGTGSSTKSLLRGDPHSAYRRFLPWMLGVETLSWVR
jgi:hypothetical protein